MTTKDPSETTVVVGAGIIGIACAHYLSQAGFQVTVIDRGRIGGACSHANCGYICPSHVLPLTEPATLLAGLKSLFNPNAPFRIKPQPSPMLWKWMWQFARRCNHRQMIQAGTALKTILDSSMIEYRDLMTNEDLDCQWKDKGLLYVLRTQRGIDEFSKTDQLLTERFGVRATRIEADALPQVDAALKPGLAGAFHYESDASVKPDVLIKRWTEQLKQRGVRFVEHCEVFDFVRSSGGIKQLKTSSGEMSADHFVVATGAWSPKLSRQLRCNIPIQPGKGYSVTMTRPTPCPTYPMLFPEHKVGVTPFESSYRLGSMMEFSGYDASIPARRIDQLRRSAEPYVVTPHTDGTLETWYGWRPMTWDSLPIIGPVPKLDNTYLATGHNMLGLSLATATGKLISEMVSGQATHVDAAPFSPTRF